MNPRAFASDNNAGVHPEVLAALTAANGGHVRSYGHDALTERARELFRTHFGARADAWLVFNGTAANVLGLGAVMRPHHAVICSDGAHIQVDECGAPERFTGSKLLPVRCPDGKLRPTDLPPLLHGLGDEHRVQPRVLSLTQATELGTVYSVEEVRAIAAIAKRRHLKLHMDGARFANAVATLGCHPSDITWRAGVDVLCFGGTKNGLPVGEAVVFFDRALSEDFAYRVKQAGQLASKMRFISAPWLGLLENDTWLANARHANAMATRLYQSLQPIPGVELLHPPQANAVFACLPRPMIDRVRAAGWRFYEFIAGGGCRFMCSWDTRPESVDALAADIAQAAADAATA